MLTGRALFSGDTVTDIIAAVVTEEPDLEALPAATAGPCAGCSNGACARTRARGCRDMGAARLELQDVRAGRGRPVDAASGDSGEAAETEQGGEGRSAGPGPPSRSCWERWRQRSPSLT